MDRDQRMHAMWVSFCSLEDLRVFHGNPHHHTSAEDTFKAAVGMYVEEDEA